MLEDRGEGASALVFGEALFDVFDGHQVPGGAPFNVAWNLRGLGDRPRLVTRVGEDARGAELIATMEAWSLDTAGVQRDPRRPTGVVRVVLGDGQQPRFDILPDQAYDHIAFVEDALPSAVSLLYHGSLALRSSASRASFEGLRAKLSAPRFVDANLRAPWYRRREVEELLRGADYVKLSADEAAELTGAAFEPGRAGALRERLGIGALIVTCGGRGLLLFDDARDGLAVPAPAASKLVDTVGAGDAVSAAMIYGLGRGWTLERAAALGVSLGSRVCGLRGATTPERSFYLAALDA